MTRTLMLGAAAAALMLSGAMAQSPSSSPSSSSPPAAQSSRPASSGKADFISSQKPDQLLATRFKGTDVVGADNRKIGAISDILFDKSGKIEAYVVAVGGFLGMGAKEVALAPNSFDVIPGQNGAAPQLKLSMSQDELKNAQAFARYEPPRPTTTGSGLGGGMRPSTNTPPSSR